MNATSTSTASKPVKRNFKHLSVMLRPVEIEQVADMAKEEMRPKSQMARILILEALEARGSRSAS
jgi:hypothetical protein